MKIRILSLLVMALAAVGAAQAAILPCAAGTVASVRAQGDCSIGDKIFNFYDYFTHTYGGIDDYHGNVAYPAGMNSDNSAGAVGFLPLTDDPLAPGFRLTGSFWSSASAPAASDAYAEEWAYLYFLVRTASGDARITGMAAAMNDWSLATSPDSICDPGLCYSQAGDVIQGYLDSPNTFLSYEPSQIQYSGQLPNFGIAAAATPAGPPASSASGWAYFETFAESASPSGSAGDGSASASFAWADYRITQSESAVPEPGSWLLLGAAWVPLLLWGRRARRVR